MLSDTFLDDAIGKINILNWNDINKTELSLDS